MSAPTEAPVSERVQALVGSRAARLQREYRANDASAVATLALLRRSVGNAPGYDARIIPFTIEGLYPPFDISLPDEPLPEEMAAHAAMTLFALHQQSRRERSMHERGYSFGRSARLLGRHTDRDGVRRRYNALTTAETWDEILHHARGLVQQFRAAGIPLDYGRFARDLYWLQQPDHAKRVWLAWGRDYYRASGIEDDDESDATDADSTDDTIKETP